MNDQKVKRLTGILGGSSAILKIRSANNVPKGEASFENCVKQLAGR